MSYSWPGRALWLAAGLAALALGGSGSAQVDATTLACPTGPAVASADGKKRLAMIVGVSTYRDNRKLEGAVKDAGAVYDFLVNSPGGVFPKKNVCVLTNSKATYAGFKAAFQNALIARAAGADEVLVYYAGHGSVLPDDNSDETDGRDETLFLHDSSPRQRDGVKYNQLRDDEFNGLLAALYAQTKNVSVILDSCHSGSATRDFGDEKARSVPPETPASPQTATADTASFAEFQPTVMGDAVFISAARDSELAKETSLGGKFTKALLEVLGRPDAKKITYDQLMARVAGAMAAVSNRQNPVLAGNGSRFVFSSDIPYRPRFDWTVVVRSDGAFRIRGLPTPGMGVGAEFLILPGSMTAEQAKDPGIAKARMRATTMLSGNEWVIEPVNAQQKTSGIRSGDWAQLVRPSPSARQLRLRLRPPAENGGIAEPGAFVEMMKEPIKRVFGEGRTGLVTFNAPGFDFEISRAVDGALQLADANGVVRNATVKPATGDANDNERLALARVLSNHFQQMTLLAAWRPNGGSLTPNRSLEVSLVPMTSGSSAPDCVGAEPPPAGWPAGANKPQRVPLCAFYRIKVKLAPDVKVPLHIAASVLSADGKMFAYPRSAQDDRLVDTAGIELRPVEGENEAVLIGTIQADAASLGKSEYIYVLGLPAIARGEGTANFDPAFDIPWHLLQTGSTRSLGTPDVNEKEYGTYTILRIVTVNR